MAKTELEEAGLETEGMVESTAKLRSEILALSGVDIMENANEFKSTYKIMDELAAKWENLTDIQQATVTELIAGKRQGNIVSSLMTNFDTARDALETSLNSSGSAMKEHEKWQQSLEAQINKLKASWQSLSQSFLSSDFLNGALDAVIGLVDGLNKLIDTFGTLPTLLSTVAAGLSLFKNKGLFTFDKDSKSIQLFGTQLTGLKAKYAQMQTVISRYNSVSSKSASFQAAYNKTLQNSSTSMGDYLRGLNGAKGSVGGYIASLIGAKAATIGLQIATTALNAALTMGVSMLVSLAIDGVMKLVNADKELAESVEELTSKFQEQHNELKKLKGDYDTSNESSMISKYEKLSKGVDNLGRNVALTAEEYSEYQDIVNKIAEQIPTVVSGYDEQGNAILNVKGNVEELTKAYEKLIHVENQKILSQNSGSIEENFENNISDAKDYGFLENVGNSLAAVPYYFGLDTSSSSPFDMKLGTAKEIERLLNTEKKSTEYKFTRGQLLEVTQTLANAGYDVDYNNVLEVLENALREEPKKIRNILDSYYAQFDEAVAQYKIKATSLLSEAFDVSSSISGLNYGNISEELQNVAYQTINSLDFDFLYDLKEKGKTIGEWTEEMLDELNSISEKDNAEIEAAFDLQTKFNGGEISYGEYVQGLQNVESTIDNLSLKKSAKNQLKLSLGLDEDGVVGQYDALFRRLHSKNLLTGELDSEVKEYIDGLSAEELSILMDIIPRVSDHDLYVTLEDVKKAIRRESVMKGLVFDLDIKVETTGIEALNTALAESVSATGLSSESITALKSRYSELESQGYELSTVFEETSNGIHINRTELNKLEKVYASQKLKEINGDLAEMKAEYDRIGKELETCGAEAKAGLYNDRLTLEQKIVEAATLASQYEGLTSAYNSWLSAESSGSERDMYEKIIEGFENIDDEISRGWLDDGTIEFLRLIKGENISATATTKELTEAYKSLDDTIKNTTYSVRDFFTVDEDGNSTNTGVYNFLDAIGQLEEEKFGGKDVVKRDKNGNIISFDFKVAGGDEAIADALGISKELVQIMVRAADDAGFVVSIDGTYRQLADLQNEANNAVNYLNELFDKDYSFDFNTDNVDSLNEQLDEAHKILDNEDFWNKNGTFNFDADGATQAMTIVSTLQAKLDKITEEKYGIGLTVEDEEFEEPLQNLQDYGRHIATLNQLKLNPEANFEEIDQINAELDKIAEEFDGLSDEKKIKIGLVGETDKIALTQKYLDGLSDKKKIELGFVDEEGNPLSEVTDVIKNKLESGEIEIPAVLDIQTNMDKNIETLADLALLNSGLLSEDEEIAIEQKYKIKATADEDDVDTSDVEESVENTFSSLGLFTTGKSKEENRTANIKLIAETAGVENVDELTDKLKGLDDKTVQAVAYAMGKIDVDKLRGTIALLKPKQVEAIAEAVGEGNVWNLYKAINELEPRHVQAIAEALGYDDVDELNTAIISMDGKTLEVVAQALGITDVEGLKGAIDNVESKDVEVKATTSGESKLSGLKSIIDGIKSKTVTVTSWFKKITSGGSTRNDSNGFSEVNGTANVNGTTGRAFKQGSWGTKNSGTALVGELGRETLIRNGRYYTVGDYGAEFIKYQRGDIILNHKQTEELLKNGKVTSDGGRAKALVGGTAFVEGTAFEGGSFGFGGIGKVITNAAKSVVDKVKDAVDKVIKKKTDNQSENDAPSTKGGNPSTSSGSDGINDAGDVSKLDREKTDSSDDKTDKFEETVDWVEIALSRMEREIDNLDKKVGNVYKSWSERNTALGKEINKVGDAIALQQSAAQEYLKEANQVGLSESYAKKIRDGSLSIEDFEGESDEKLVEKIKDYQSWYEKYLDCIDAAEELCEQESKLYAQRFENVQSQYNAILQGYEHTESMLNEYISQAEAQGHIVSEKYYNALIENEKQNINTLKQEQASLIKARDEAVANNTIPKYTEDWYRMCAEIDGVTQAIEEGATALIEYNNAIRDIDWQKFDLVQERISDVTAESEFLIELMSNKDLFEDDGKFTERGVATMGLHALNYNTSMYQADDYGKEIAKIDKQIAKDPYDQELINRRRELIELQRESILEAENQKNAIKDLVEEGINLELDALQERIDLHNEELDSMKDLYDYQKNVEEQTKNIASLRKQLGAYEGFDDEETRAKVQELKVSLEEAEADLQETEYDKFISDQTALLDTLYTDYETILNTRLDNIDFLLEQVIDGINIAAGADGTITSALGESGAIALALGSNATTIGETLKTEVGAVGTKLSTAMSSIWAADGTGKAVIDFYGKDFQNKQTTTNDALNKIKADVAAMVDDVDKDAQKKVATNKTSTSAKKDPTKDTPTTTKPKTTTTNKSASSGDGKAKVGDKVKFVSGKYYYDSQGKKPLGSKYQGKEVYITSINTKSWATHPYHISTGKKLGSGDLGWLKLNQLSGYTTGKRKASGNEYAWTQEDGLEYIVRPSDGAILTPVAKGDSVLNAAATGNIWSMANNPSGFIKDNLKLDSANVPDGANVQNSYTQHLEKVVFNMPNVKNYDEFLAALQRDKNFERLLLSMSIDRIAGKSSLAKGKSIR